MQIQNATFIQTKLIMPDICINQIPNFSPYIQLINNNNADIKRKYGEGKEAHMIRDEIGDFDPMTSDAMKLLRQYYGYSLRITELKGLINAIRDYMAKKGVDMPKLSRNANRSFQLCVKYVQDNLDIMKDIIPFVKLCDDQGNVIPVSEY